VSSDLAAPRGLPAVPAAIFGALALIGLITFAVGTSSADPETSQRTYRVFLHNWLLWAALAQGALVLSSAIRLTNGRWAGPIHRLVDSLGAFVPLSLLLFIGIYMGRHELFAWIETPVYGKEWWFSESFTFTRDFVGLIWMTFVSFIYLYLSVRPMLGTARETATGWQGALYKRWTAGWRGEDAERDLGERRLRKMAAVLILSYSFVYSLLGIDMIMSLAPHWISSLFPAYYAWGGFLSAISMTALLALLLRNSRELVGQVTEARRHDLGKMIFAFSIFWMYLFWSQYLVIWYANIPEETGFIVARLGTQFVQETWYLGGFWTRISEPYVKLTLVTWILCWVLPFWVLLGEKPKKTPAILGTVAVGSLLGFALERYILVTPSLISPEQVLAGAAVTPLGPIEIGIFLGFAGLFFLAFLAFARVFPGALPVQAE
jgi:hypothetical protein